VRYVNRKSQVSIDLGKLDAAKARLYETALARFRGNANWFEFEQFVFSYTSPLFSKSRSRAEVIDDPLYAALKDMWLQLGIDQGFVADDRHQTQARAAGAHRPTVIRDVAPPGEPPVPRRRRR
jgi:hypothetical protein